MKALKIGALVMSALLLVMVLMMAYLFMTAEVTAQVVSSVGVSAAEQEGYFTALKTSVDEDTFIGTLYQKPTQWKDASEYVLSAVFRQRPQRLSGAHRHDRDSGGATAYGYSSAPGSAGIFLEPQERRRFQRGHSGPEGHSSRAGADRDLLRMGRQFSGQDAFILTSSSERMKSGRILPAGFFLSKTVKYGRKNHKSDSSAL